MARKNDYHLRQTGQEVQDILDAVENKAQKDLDAVEGNVAVFDDAGNPVDGGKSIEDIVEIPVLYCGEEVTAEQKAHNLALVQSWVDGSNWLNVVSLDANLTTSDAAIFQQIPIHIYQIFLADGSYTLLVMIHFALFDEIHAISRIRIEGDGTVDYSFTLGEEQFFTYRVIVLGQLGEEGVETAIENPSSKIELWSNSLIDADGPRYRLESPSGPNSIGYGYELHENYYDYYFDTGDKTIRLRAYEDRVTTLWRHKVSPSELEPPTLYCGSGVTSEQKAHNLEVIRGLISEVQLGAAVFPANKTVRLDFVGNSPFLLPSYWHIEVYQITPPLNDGEPYVVFYHLHYTLFGDAFISGHFQTINGELPGKEYFLSQGNAIPIVTHVSFTLGNEGEETTQSETAGGDSQYVPVMSVIDGAIPLYDNEGGIAYGFSYDSVNNWYECYFDKGDRTIRLRVYDDNHITTLWRYKTDAVDLVILDGGHAPSA